MTNFLTMKTFSLGSWTSLGRLVWHEDLILRLAFLLSRTALPFKGRLVLDCHHMTAANAFLDVTLGYL
jgi:cytochrome oxidase assembly protein ShyY1